MLEKTTWMNQLYDRYGALLSEKQQRYMQFYYLDDLSLSEIAEEENVSRQAVFEQIRRAEEALELFEEKMNLLEKSKQREKLYQSLEQLVSSSFHQHDAEVKQILQKLREID